MQNILTVGYQLLHPDARAPTYAHTDDAGLDLYALREITLTTREVTKVETGLAIELPRGYEAQIRPRSGLAKHGVCMPNSPGTIDCGYRGEVCVLLTLLPLLGRKRYDASMHIDAGYRIAQMLIKPVPVVRLVERQQLSETERGDGGFGSTGL